MSSKFMDFIFISRASVGREGFAPSPHNLHLHDNKFVIDTSSRVPSRLAPVKSLAPLLAVAVQSILDDGIRLGCGLNLVDLD